MITETIRTRWDSLSDGAKDHVIATRKEIVSRLFYVAEDGEHCGTIEASSLEEALNDWGLNEDIYRADRTVYVTLAVTSVATGERLERTIQIEPEEPSCEMYGRRWSRHEWESPLEVVGGLRENPGVSGHGGGVIITEVCRHCGGYRIEDTWAQNPSTGEQGLRSIEYREADDASEAWVRSLTEEA